MKYSGRCFLFILIISELVFLSGCKVSYSFTGASIPPEMKTISVQYFQNHASIVQTGLGQYITDALIDKCKAQTNLSLVNSLGDADFEGEIIDYNTRPQTVAADAQAATNRFTITVRVKYSNLINPELSFDQTFSRYEDYDSQYNLDEVEEELSAKIVELLVEDIFNKAFVNW